MSSSRSTLENLFGVRLIATGVPVEQIDKSLKPGDLDLVLRAPRTPTFTKTRGRCHAVMLATEWRKADFDAMIRERLWPDVDPRRTVLLENAPTGCRKRLVPAPRASLRYQNTDIEIEADAPGGGFVVLNDVWHPWWRASVDDKAAEILKANVLFRAVVVPPGRHVVRFTFHPFSGAFAELKEKLSALLR
jgi:hypothetical protein